MFEVYPSLVDFMKLVVQDEIQTVQVADNALQIFIDIFTDQESNSDPVVDIPSQ